MSHGALMESLRRLSAIAGIGVGACFLLAGCDVFKPKSDFYGVIKNETQYRVYAWNPAKHGELHQLDPNDQFACYLKGSENYEFKAWLNDSTVVADFQGRINQVSGDAQVSGSNVDWAWIIGGPFMAALEPTSRHPTR